MKKSIKTRKRKPQETKVELREKMLEYLSNPANDNLDRLTLATQVLGYENVPSMYARFPAAELDEIYSQALEIRRRRYGKELMKVDKGLLLSASQGNPHSAKLVFQRYEGWSEKQIREHKFDGQSFKAFVDPLPEPLKSKVIEFYESYVLKEGD